MIHPNLSKISFAFLIPFGTTRLGKISFVSFKTVRTKPLQSKPVMGSRPSLGDEYLADGEST